MDVGTVNVESREVIARVVAGMRTSPVVCAVQGRSLPSGEASSISHEVLSGAKLLPAIQWSQRNERQGVGRQVCR